MKHVVIVPTYNERHNLAHLVELIQLQGEDFHILIVDDNSPDGTGDLADQLASETPRLRVIHRPGKMGLGTAYVAGFHWALDYGADLIFEMDADFSHDPAMLPRFVDAIQDCDLVLGSRYVAGGGVRNWPWYRQWMSIGGSLYARLILGVGIRDLTGGFKCFRPEVLKTIGLNGIETSGYAFQIEMTYRTLLHGFRVKEIPIVFVDRVHGKSKMSRRVFLEAVIAVPKLRLKLSKPAERTVNRPPAG